MKHLTCTCHSLNIFKILIANDMHYYPSFIPNVFPTFTYNSTHPWCRNSMSYIIKYFIISPIFLMGRSFNSVFLRRLYSSTLLETHNLFIL